MSNTGAQVKGKLHNLASKGADLTRSESQKKGQAEQQKDGAFGADTSVTRAVSSLQLRPQDAVHSSATPRTLPGDNGVTPVNTSIYQGHLPETRATNESRKDVQPAGEPASNCQSRSQSPHQEPHIPQSTGPESQMAEKYVLRVSAGADYASASHFRVPVNSSSPVRISSKSMDILLFVRIRDFSGLPRHFPASQSTTSYFTSSARKNDQYSIGFSFVPKRDIPSEKLVWGNDFDHPVRDRLPPGFNTAFSIVKQFIDPGLECDAYADEPWLYGPALSCWFALDTGDKVSLNDAGEVQWPTSVQDGSIPLEESDTGSLRKELSIPVAAAKRRKHFLRPLARQAFTFEKGRLYSADFFNPYLDFNKFALKLPGFSLGVLRYIGDKTHTLRYVFKEVGPGGSADRQGGEVFFVVEMTLLYGEDATKGIEEDKMGWSDNKQDDHDHVTFEDAQNSTAEPELTKEWTQREGFGQVNNSTDVVEGGL